MLRRQKIIQPFQFLYFQKSDFLSSELQGFMKVTMSGKISLVEAMMKHRKMMRNKCSEQNLQVNIQYYI